MSCTIKAVPSCYLETINIKRIIHLSQFEFQTKIN